jgi:hypothetical protein
MARKFINMYLDTSDYSGFWIVEYIDNDGTTKKDRFGSDLEAKIFYDTLMS